MNKRIYTVEEYSQLVEYASHGLKNACIMQGKLFHVDSDLAENFGTPERRAPISYIGEFLKEPVMDIFYSKEEDYVVVVTKADTSTTEALVSEAERQYEIPDRTLQAINIWKNSTDKDSVEKMFYIFTGMDIAGYLEKALNIKR